MLAYRNRLHTRDFPNAAKGRRLPFVGGTFVFIPGGDQFRAGVVVPKKVSKTAILRNRIRRYVYRALQRNLASLPAGTCVVFPDVGCQNIPMETLAESLAAVLIKK